MSTQQFSRDGLPVKFMLFAEVDRGVDQSVEFAEQLGVPPSQLSRSAKRARVSRMDAERVRKLVQKDSFTDEQRRQVTLLLQGKSLFDQDSLTGPETPAKSGWSQPPFVPIERAAWGWALTFRNRVLLQELATQAHAQGLDCQRIRDGVILREGTRGKKNRGPNSSLFCHPNSKLRPGTVVLLGASDRHPHSTDLFQRFSEKLGATIRLNELADSPAYFGYPTTLKCLEVTVKGRQARIYHSRRYTDGERLLYGDVAGIFHGPLDELFAEHKYGKDVSHLIWIAAIQRLANGVGMRLVRDAEFRSTHLGEISFDADEGTGGLIFDVTVAHSEMGDEIRSVSVLDDLRP